MGCVTDIMFITVCRNLGIYPQHIAILMDKGIFSKPNNGAVAQRNYQTSPRRNEMKDHFTADPQKFMVRTLCFDVSFPSNIEPTQGLKSGLAWGSDFSIICQNPVNATNFHWATCWVMEVLSEHQTWWATGVTPKTLVVYRVLMVVNDLC